MLPVEMSVAAQTWKREKALFFVSDRFFEKLIFFRIHIQNYYWTNKKRARSLYFKWHTTEVALMRDSTKSKGLTKVKKTKLPACHEWEFELLQMLRHVAQEKGEDKPRRWTSATFNDCMLVLYFSHTSFMRISIYIHLNPSWNHQLYQINSDI